MNGWIGVDLDGTLAHYETWEAPDVIGDPIPTMLARVNRWLAEGWEVRIVTARVSPLFLPNHPLQEQAKLALMAIKGWCIKYLGVPLPVTAVKDLDMIELWDDRAVQVEMNTGVRVGYSTRGSD